MRKKKGLHLVAANTEAPERPAAAPLAPAPKPPAPPPAPKPQAPAPYTPEPEYPVPAEVDPLLVTVLSSPRRHGTTSERMFCAWLRWKLANMGATVDDRVFDQFSVTIPYESGKTTDVLFCCHLDTVDPYEPTLKPGDEDKFEMTYKSLCYDSNFGIVFLHKDSHGESLGADDGVGVWMLLKMIEAKVPGTYLFHRGEEVGGLGAKAIAKDEVEWLKQFNLAVEFDRPGTSEVITHQRGGTRCASDKFGLALAERLNRKGLQLSPSTRGVYTDVFEYRHTIPECVNVAVGYSSQHTTSEELDYGYAALLLETVIATNWWMLPIDRDIEAEAKAEAEARAKYHYPYSRDHNWYMGGHAGYWGFGGDYDSDEPHVASRKRHANQDDEDLKAYCTGGKSAPPGLPPRDAPDDEEYNDGEIDPALDLLLDTLMAANRTDLFKQVAALSSSDLTDVMLVLLAHYKEATDKLERIRNIIDI